MNTRDPEDRQAHPPRQRPQKGRRGIPAALLGKVAQGSYVDERTAPTVAQAIDHWLADKNGKVKPSTLKGYKVVANGAIRGPLLIGTRQERADYTESGIAPKGARFIKLLGHVKLTELTTAMIRIWHRTIVEQCGTYTANRAKMPPQVDPGARRGGLHRSRAVDADRAVSRPAQAEEGDPDVGRHPPAHRRLPRMIRSTASTTRSRSLPARDRPSSWACCGARWTLTTMSSAFAASRSATAR